MGNILKNNITIDFGTNVWSSYDRMNTYPWALVGVESTAVFNGTTGGIDTYKNADKIGLDAQTDYTYCLTVGDMKLHEEQPDGTIKRTTTAPAGGGIKGNLTINGGTYMGTFDVLYVTNGVCTINGGTFFAQPDSSQKSSVEAEKQKYGLYRNFTLNLYDSFGKRGDAAIYVNGGTFYGFDPADNYAEGEGTNFVTVNHSSYATGETYTYMVKDINREDNGTLVTVPVYKVVATADVPEDKKDIAIAGNKTIPTAE